MRKITLFLMSLFLTVGAMAQEGPTIVGMKSIPQTKVDLSKGLKSGYYLLKQVNDNASAAGGQGVGWIKAASEADNASVTSKYTGDPGLKDLTYVWYVEVVDEANCLIKISTANKVAAWQAPWQHQKNLVAYVDGATLKYHTGTVNLSGDARPYAGSCFISNEGVTAFVHFSADYLGSWTDTNQNSMFMVEFYEVELDYYTPNHTGTKTRTNRLVGSMSVGDDTYTMPANSTDVPRNSYTDLTGTKTFTVQAGSKVALAMTQSAGTWMNAFVYVDMDNNGFTAGINADGYTPTGDLVAYSFYNNGATSDENGRNSDGEEISGGNRSTLDLPEWTVPANLTPGEYRIRFKYDWCNINPYGDTGNYFSNSFAGHGAEIIDFTLKVVNPHTLTVTDAGWATLYLDFNAAIPENVDAYIVTGLKKDNWLDLAEVEGTIPANTGVLVNASEGSYIFNYSTTAATTDCSDNKLEGSVTATTVEKEAYVLGYAKGTTDVVFGKAELTNGSFLNNANKAYLPATSVAGASLSANLRFDFDGITTAIEEVETEAAETVIYDLTGRRVNEITKAGVYVVNGRKVLVK